LRFKPPAAVYFFIELVQHTGPLCHTGLNPGDRMLAHHHAAATLRGLRATPTRP
jgi:hypothetical protein